MRMMYGGPLKRRRDMTKVYQTVTKTIERKEVVSRACDWCGIDIPFPARYQSDEFILKYTSSTNGPYENLGEGWEVEDLCNDCVDKLKELLVSVGIKLGDIDY
jgi:hypothetical protein